MAISRSQTTQTIKRKPSKSKTGLTEKGKAPRFRKNKKKSMPSIKVKGLKLKIKRPTKTHYDLIEEAYPDVEID